MKLWLISQDENDTWDTFDGAVVAAETEIDAQHTSPRNYVWHDDGWYYCYSDGRQTREDNHSGWTDPTNVKVVYLGEAKEGTQAGVILGSFNAG